MSRQIAMSLMMVLGVTLAVWGQSSTQPAADAELESQLAEIGRRAAAVTDLTADFVQLKHTALLKKPMETKGTLRVKGDRMRWDTVSPSPGVMTIDAAEMQLYSPGHKLLEIYPMRNGLGQIAASPLPQLAVVREHFRIDKSDWPDGEPGKKDKPETLALRLTPIEDSLRKHVQEVRVLLDIGSGCAQAVRLIDADGDELEITFTKIRINTGLRDDQVRFEPPKGTEVSRPLDAGSGAGGQR